MTTPSVTLRVAMADRMELFERCNRMRIVASSQATGRPRARDDASVLRPAGMGTVSPSREELIAVTKLDMENAEDLAKQAGKMLAVEAVEVGRKRIRRRVQRRARKLERSLEKVARKLPVDTPVDKRRRRRTAGRATWLVRLVLATAVVAAIYVAWRARNRREGTAEDGPAPDGFGTAVESDDGERSSTVTSTEG